MTVSVLMSVYKGDNPRWLESCFESLRSQTLSANEIVLVKDGYLTPELDFVIASWQKILPLNVVGYVQNHGLAYALNYGIDFCCSDLIARMDADDICYPERFEKQVARFVQNPELQILGTGIEEFYVKENGDEICNIRLYPPVTNKYSKSLYKGTPIAHPTVMTHSEVLRKFRYNLKNQKYSQDIELWFRLVENGFEIETIQAPLLRFRITEKTFMRRNISKACNELKIYISSLKRINGFSIMLIYPILRFISRLLPVFLIKKMYFSKLRGKIFK